MDSLSVSSTVYNVYMSSLTTSTLIVIHSLNTVTLRCITQFNCSSTGLNSQESVIRVRLQSIVSSALLNNRSEVHVLCRISRRPCLSTTCSLLMDATVMPGCSMYPWRLYNSVLLYRRPWCITSSVINWLLCQSLNNIILFRLELSILWLRQLQVYL